MSTAAWLALGFCVFLLGYFIGCRVGFGMGQRYERSAQKETAAALPFLRRIADWPQRRALAERAQP